jgi:hypothetical protein
MYTEEFGRHSFSKLHIPFYAFFDGHMDVFYIHKLGLRATPESLGFAMIC